MTGTGHCRGDDPAHGLGPTRARVLALLQDAGAPLSAAAMAERLTLHVNTARFHLEALAEEAGHAWGRHLTPQADGHPDEPRAAQALIETLDRVGFESHATVDDEARTLEITHCPFLEVAADHPEVVCSVHLGLLRGAAEQLDAPLTAERLDPLVAPGLCVARLGPRSGSRRARGGAAHARKATTSSRAGTASGIGSSG